MMRVNIGVLVEQMRGQMQCVIALLAVEWSAQA